MKDVALFQEMIEKHRTYLLAIRHYPSKVVQRDRNAIISSLMNDMRFAHWNGTINWKDYQELKYKLRDRLSLDSLYGIKQLSIFDEIPEEELHPKPEVINE